MRGTPKYTPAGLGAGLGGYLAGLACQRLGARWGYRLIPLIVMPSASANFSKPSSPNAGQSGKFDPVWRGQR